MFIMPTHVQKPREIIETGFRLWRSTLTSVWPFSLLFALASIIYHFTFIAVQDKGNLWMHTLLYTLVSLLAHASIIDCINYIVEVEGAYNPTLSMAFKKTFILLIVSIMMVLIVGFGLALLIVPGVIFLVGFLFAPYLAIINYRSSQSESFGESVIYAPRCAIESMKNSWNLVSKDWRFSILHFSPIFLALFSVFLILWSITWLIGYFAHGEYVKQQAVLILFFIINTLFYPLVHSLILTVLYDLQLKKSLQV